MLFLYLCSFCPMFRLLPSFFFVCFGHSKKHCNGCGHIEIFGEVSTGWRLITWWVGFREQWDKIPALKGLPSHGTS